MEDKGTKERLQENFAKFYGHKPGVTKTEGGDHKTHEIPDELWKYIDVFVDSYNKYKDSKWHYHPLLDAGFDLDMVVWDDDHVRYLI